MESTPYKHETTYARQDQACNVTSTNNEKHFVSESVPNRFDWYTKFFLFVPRLPARNESFRLLSSLRLRACNTLPWKTYCKSKETETGRKKRRDLTDDEEKKLIRKAQREFACIIKRCEEGDAMSNQPTYNGATERERQCDKKMGEKTKKNDLG